VFRLRFVTVRFSVRVNVGMRLRHILCPLAAVFCFLAGVATFSVVDGLRRTTQPRQSETAMVLPTFSNRQPFRPPPPASRLSFSMDPLVIRKLIDENRSEFPVYQLWEFLSVGPEMKFLSNPSLKRDEELEFASCHSCEIELRLIDLDGDLDNDAVLGIASLGGFGDYRLLAFERVKGGWRFAGYTDHDINKYYSPKMRMARFGKERFLVLTCQGGWGTGLRISFERWYTLKDGEFRELISFPNESFTAQTSGDLVQDSRARVVTYATKNGFGRFTVHFRNRFSAHAECSPGDAGSGWSDVDVFTVQKKAVYVEQKSGRFALDRSASEIFENEIYEAHTPWGLSPKQFRQFYSREIVFIQKNASRCEREWLNSWLAREDEWE